MKVAKVDKSANGHEAIVVGTDSKIFLENLHYTPGSTVALCYHVMDLPEFKSRLLNKNNIWVVYEFTPTNYKHIFEYRQRYEDLVCGFLQYYDREVRNGMSDHSIYFHWGNWQGKSNCVVIFIDEPPLRFPVKYTSGFYGKMGSYFERENYNTAPYYGGTLEIDPPSAGLSDPPKPPPPPPPY
ncbi:MAG TPA: hypothetical protein VK772_01050 [Puia sp.]|jgi:hypothetical protein|nr:hypothetical protein [Puia sp.]